MAHPIKFTPKKQKEFIRLLSETGNVSKCCKALNLDRETVYRYRRSNKKFAKEWEIAKEAYIGLLEDESWRRAFKGIDKAVWYKGELVGIEKQFSDTLLMHRLNAERPDKYQYRQRIDANVNGNITVKVMKFSDKSKKKSDGNNDTK